MRHRVVTVQTRGEKQHDMLSPPAAPIFERPLHTPSRHGQSPDARLQQSCKRRDYFAAGSNKRGKSARDCELKLADA